MRITGNIPGGNIKVLAVDAWNATLDVELRDTPVDWFFWSFKAELPAAGRYTFTFPEGARISSRGPAVSIDGGLSWEWLGADKVTAGQSFVYAHDGQTPEVYFCMGMQYLQKHWELFMRAEQGKPYCQPGTLCRSRQGRLVEMLTVREGTPRHTLFLTSRHHAGEMMATRVLEGLLRTVLADDEFGRAFRRDIAVYAVPFVDKDGVENGDQGKSRTPHDHNRDYTEFLYPETRAIADLIDEVKGEFVLDLHCPWIYGGVNERPYLVGAEEPRFAQEMERFGAILEQESPAAAPYRTADNIRFGTLWNTAANYSAGASLARSLYRRPFVRYGQTLEIPFANFREHTFGQPEAALFGAAVARAVYRYFTGA